MLGRALALALLILLPQAVAASTVERSATWSYAHDAIFAPCASAAGMGAVACIDLPAGSSDLMVRVTPDVPGQIACYREGYVLATAPGQAVITNTIFCIVTPHFLPRGAPPAGAIAYVVAFEDVGSAAFSATTLTGVLDARITVEG